MKTKTVLALVVIGLFMSTFGAHQAEAMGRGGGMKNHPRFSQMNQKMQNMRARNARKGKVMSISADKITLSALNRPLTVDITIDSETKFLNKNNDPISLADIKIGDEVKVGGVRWNKDGKIFGFVRMVRTLDK